MTYTNKKFKKTIFFFHPYFFTRCNRQRRNFKDLFSTYSFGWA